MTLREGRSPAREAAERLKHLGFNVVPIGADKKPLGSWSAERPVFKPEDFDGAEAIAITGNYNADTSYKTVILDIDAPSKASELLNEVFGGDWRRALCSSPWSFCGLTGPRCPVDGSKHGVVCNGGRCRHGDHEFSLQDAERGMYVVLRVPAQCVKHGFSTKRSQTLGVELIYSNYQLVWGRHPSGVVYQPVRWTSDRWEPAEFGPGEIVTCDEFGRLIRLVDRWGREDEGGERAEEPPAELPEPVRPLREDPSELVEMLKRLWALEAPGGGHYHDLLLFSIASLARRAGVKEEEVRALFEPVFSWAVQNGHDTERDVEGHHKKVIEWVYRRGTRLWGKRRFEELIRGIVKEHGLGDQFADVFISATYSVLGFHAERPTCIAIQYKRGRGGLEKTRMICNTPRGVVELVKATEVDKEAYAECVEAGGDKAECRKKATAEVYREKVLANVYIASATMYRDYYIGTEYISANIIVPGSSAREEYKMLRFDRFVESLERHRVYSSPSWPVIFDKYPTVVDVVVSGFVCPPPETQLPCRVRDYFGTGIDRDPDPPAAASAFSAVVSVLDAHKPDDGWVELMLYALAQSMFVSFALTRKLHGVRTSIVALVGKRHAGKTTVANITARAFFPNVPLSQVVAGASRSLTAARIGRLQEEVVTTWAAIDEADRISKSQEGAVMATLKSYVTSHHAWATAHGQKFPAYAGLVLTANNLELTDPELADKVLTVEFPYETDRSREAQFTQQLFKIDLNAFGAYYQKYAEKHWPEVKNIILKNPQEEAAVEYMNVVLESLGIGAVVKKPDAAQGDASSAVVSPRELFRRYLYSVLREHQVHCRGESGPIHATACLETLIERDWVPHIRSYYGEKKMRILKSIESAIGVNIATLCADLGGELLKSTNPRYHKSCVVPKEVIEEVITLGGE